ncbi:MAG: hypothetical protein ACK4MV_18170 [Beijerinckiaceae bacterium]
MGEYTGLVMFLWIVGAPTIGFVLLSLWSPRKAAWEVSYGPAPARNDGTVRYGPDDPNRPL